jgi:hypothetical protein
LSIAAPQFAENCKLFTAALLRSLTFFVLQGSYELQVRIDAQEAGARDMQKYSYSSYSYDDVPLSSLPDIIR